MVQENGRQGGTGGVLGCSCPALLAPAPAPTPSPPPSMPRKGIERQKCSRGASDLMPERADGAPQDPGMRWRLGHTCWPRAQGAHRPQGAVNKRGENSLGRPELPSKQGFSLGKMRPKSPRRENSQPASVLGGCHPEKDDWPKYVPCVSNRSLTD